MHCQIFRDYFTGSEAYKVDAFQACGSYLRKLSHKGGDVFERRYFYVGSRHGVRIYEPYNIKINIYQRLIWQEHRNMSFNVARRSFELSTHRSLQRKFFIQQLDVDNSTKLRSHTLILKSGRMLKATPFSGEYLPTFIQLMSLFKIDV